MDAYSQLVEQLTLPSPVSQIHTPQLDRKNIQLFIKRDELIHPVIQGNKWRKLKYNLQAAIEQGHHTLLSFGGAYSNHIHALAKASQLCGLNSIGIIRGEEADNLSPTLQDVRQWGMQLEFISRADYRDKTDPDFIESLHKTYGDFYLIPEGGDNQLARKGCAELLDELEEDYDMICCEVGSGTMLSALIEHNPSPDTAFTGFVVMKNPQLDQSINKTLPNNCPTQWQLNHDYHFGGFARTSETLNRFIQHFKTAHKIQLEPVYSGKMLYGIFDMIEQGNIKHNSRVLAIHGGGLQGLRGFDF